MKTKWQKRPVDDEMWHWHWDGLEESEPTVVRPWNVNIRSDKELWMVIPMPKRPGKQPAKPRPRNLQFDAIVQVCGIAEKDLPTQASHVAKVALLLKEFPPEEIFRRGNIYRAKYPGYDLTPGALQKNWSNCSEGPKRSNPTNQERIMELKKAIRESPAFVGGPYYATFATESDRNLLKMWKEELKNITQLNFDELRD